MIVSFRDDWLRAFFVEDVRSRHIPRDLEDRLFRKLQMIDDATNDQDLRIPPSNHFEKLRKTGGIPFDPRQPAVATYFPLERQPRGSEGRLSGRSQLQMR